MAVVQTVLLTLIVLLVSSCSQESPIIGESGCTGCHQVQLDTNHDFSCLTCHEGTENSDEKLKAHTNLIAQPAHPANMLKSCGSCHKKHIDSVPHSLHFTLSKSTNMFRKSFGAETTLSTFSETPVIDTPETISELADDLLRRRCFRCHLFSSGDPYPFTSRGTGCSACHLSFEDGKLSSHTFQKPTDKNCLSCHYGNYVGFDYYGRFEHDYNVEYRTPYTTSEEYFRPYGVEYHQLQPDIHQKRGMTCLDCHPGEQLMEATSSEAPTCESCHIKDRLEEKIPKNIGRDGDDFTLTGKDGSLHPLVFLRDPAHFNQKEKISCQACHAQWTFNDSGKHFLRSDTDNYDLFENLSVQGSFELELLVTHNNDFDKEELPLIMTDKISGEQKAGLWYKGYTMRRWEEVLLGRDKNGVISTVRPLLDYRLSWIDEDDVAQFDSVPSSVSPGDLVPYVPHTTGPAGIFYQERLDAFLRSERLLPQ
jgi:hypothetical protein